LFCPCWTVAQLNEWFPPGAFDSMNGTACRLESLGYIASVHAKDSCSTGGRVNFSYQRSGFTVAFEQFCLTMVGDIDSDDDDRCDRAAIVLDTTPAEAEVCIAGIFRTDIYRAECRVPTR